MNIKKKINYFVLWFNNLLNSYFMKRKIVVIDYLINYDIYLTIRSKILKDNNN